MMQNDMGGGGLGGGMNGAAGGLPFGEDPGANVR